MAVTIHAGPNDAPLGHFQSSEQSRGSVAFIVVGHRSQSSFNQGQSGLGSVQRLNRGLLIGTQHQRMLGRVQIQAHDIDHFVGKLFVSADFERLGQMGLKTTGCQTRCTIDLSMPSFVANVRTLQWVASDG